MKPIFCNQEIGAGGGASLVVQWLRICLPLQGTQVQSLIGEEPRRCGTAEPVHHNQ